MSICRIQNLFGNGRYHLEMDVSPEHLNANHSYPRYYSIGLDTENGTERRFFQAVNRNYSETLGASDQKWYLDFSDGAKTTLQDIGDTSWDWADNENKMLPIRVELDVDTSTGLYHGFKLGNRLAVGSLAATPTTQLSDLGVAGSMSLPSFHGGMNICMSVTNRTTGTKTMGQLNLHFCRLTFLKGL